VLEIDPGVHHARFSLARTLFTLGPRPANTISRSARP
jgi:hypothetical protein